VRRKRLLAWLAASLVTIAVLAVLNLRWGLWELAAAQGTSSMAYGLPGCSGLWWREGFTYQFRDPRRGEIVTFHARGEIGSGVTPDPDSRQLGINKRVIALPGETVIGRNDRVYVDGRRIDDIPTEPFPPVHLRSKEYFVMGDNRSHSTDSRDFGPVPRAAIYSRAVLVVWPLDRFGVPGYDKSEIPPGDLCG
jgi:signal peptidase I